MSKVYNQSQSNTSTSASAPELLHSQSWKCRRELAAATANEGNHHAISHSLTFFKLQAPKAPIAGHVTAERCGQVVSFDLMFLPEREDGRTAVFNIIVVFSRWGQSVELNADPTAKDTIDVLDKINIPGGWGYPEVFVTDNDSKFKARLKEAIQMWNVRHKKSAPHHSKSHGVIERYNRSLQRKVALLGGSAD
jgi:hypothetical protein